MLTHGCVLQGDVDIICGGPPCQGASGNNRHRNNAEPFDDDKNLQCAVYLDLVQHLQPRFVLMENIVELLRWQSGVIGRYMLARLIYMHYQVI